jgi:hypothetical protein
VTPIRFLKPLLGTIIPLPLSMVPLPTKWKFIAHAPVSLEGLGLDSIDMDPEEKKQRLQRIADDIRGTVQRTLDRETANRRLVQLGSFFRQGKTLGTPPTREEVVAEQPIAPPQELPFFEAPQNRPSVSQAESNR